LLIACSPQKKINKAVNTVLYSESAFNKVGLQWAKLNPVDTSITKVILKSDTLTFRDTIEYHRLDTISKIETLFKIINKTTLVRDTILRYVQDNRVLYAYKDTIESYKGKLVVSNIYLSDAKKDAEKYKLRFFGLLLIIALILGISFYLKIRI